MTGPGISVTETRKHEKSFASRKDFKWTYKKFENVSHNIERSYKNVHAVVQSYTI